MPKWFCDTFAGQFTRNVSLLFPDATGVERDAQGVSLSSPERAYVEMAAEPGHVCTIYIKRGGEYVPRNMREPYPGLYTHGEILFPGEELRYYITFRDDDRDRLIKSGMLKSELIEDPEEGDSLFALTSRLVRAKTQNDRQAVRDNLYTLYKNDFLSRKLFPLPGEQ